MQNLLLDEILEKAKHQSPITRKDILRLLEITTEDEFNKLSLVAQTLRHEYFQNKIFLYGFVYFSTHCRNDCTFCLYRKSNINYPRYRKNREEILSTAQKLMDSGVHLLDLTMGEDPLYHNTKQGFSELLQIIKEVKLESNIPIMLSPGVISQELLWKFKEAGVEWYACYQETHNRSLYNRLRIEQSYDERMNRKCMAKEMGYLIEEGLLAGVGDTNEDIADSILMMKKIGADQVRVMSFVPQENTPLSNWEIPNSHFRELLIIAVMRLVMPDRLIPASLDVDGLSGLEQRLNAGANVITSIIPPSSGLAGVSNSTLDIDDGNRSIEKIIPVLKNIHLEPATRQKYQAWVKSRKNL
ncbi:pyrrolysine biosynthesis radical SAM protein [Desulfosporosinus orientis DSM 765]|uniref:Pyrrolysine biosynthesis radical SAM protein n=1 Tax=Desulfosporosinus orientis (strain ATCC 19365 / DSM 765 / NCIMB 8382 / VKM B-1628 / Singapore I) TaxID=768706 RepID=G7WAP7_DESOD|nr:methylornithine synthase PylB [Desulfosporosinus orientis]AET66815.1 pyrrolysine biosynthesis radical SAM protein [Desulfosporosinus orientis DSM 765]